MASDFRFSSIDSRCVVRVDCFDCQLSVSVVLYQVPGINSPSIDYWFPTLDWQQSTIDWQQSTIVFRLANVDHRYEVSVIDHQLPVSVFDYQVSVFDYQVSAPDDDGSSISTVDYR